MTIDISTIFQLLMGVLLGIIGYMVSQSLHRLEKLEVGQTSNTGRLIRIETKLGIIESVNPDGG